jgi:hypothetical protein
MKRITMIVTAMAFSAISFSQFYLKQGYIEMPAQNNTVASLVYKNLAIYPLAAGDQFRKETGGTVKYTTLEEALSKKKVKITENSSGGEVNRLFIENISKDTIFIMAGEVVKGGKQDRVIGDDMVLYPGTGKVDLSVFCVEHNRWGYRSDRNFDNYHSVSSNSVRKKAAVDKNQGEVWSEVDKVTEKQNAKTSTGTYAAIDQSESYKNDLNEYMDHFLKSLDKIDHCIGFVGVSGDKVIGCDIFADNELFRKQMKNLLNAYITEAISHGSPVKADDQAVKKYLSDFLHDRPDQDEKIKEKGMHFEEKGRKVHINTY